MKRILIALSLILIIIVPIEQEAQEPGGGMTYAADFDVEDQAGNNVSGVQVKLGVTTWYGDELDPDYYYDEITGITNANGYAYLEIYVPAMFLEGLDFMHAQMIDPDYSIVSSENTTTQSWQTIWPEFVVVYYLDDLDGDLVDDNLELQLAEKFKPILHKHSFDLQNGLQNFDNLLADGSFTLKVYNDNGQELLSEQITGGPNSLHKWNLWNWDTYGAGSQSNEIYNLDLVDSKRYSGAPTGQRPLYYHVYKDQSYYYVQYWYYFTMNDLRDQVSSTWHESDWEHVSIKISENAGVFTPVKVDFYLHEGGRSFTANDCWWSSTNSQSYDSIQEGYDENHTNLNVWIAANSHASYNRYSLVYRITGTLFGIPESSYQDRVDYLPEGFDLYFGYDNLVKLGEVTKQAYVECPESEYNYEFHSYRIGNTSKYWSAYRGRTGFFSGQPLVVPRSPFMPAKGDGHEWLSSTESGYFGNAGVNYIFLVAEVLWFIDDPLGD